MRAVAAALAVALASPALAQPASEPAPYGKAQGVIPGLLFGPKLSIINVPTPSVGLEVKVFNLVGASFDYGLIPDVTFSVGDIRDVTVGLTNWSIGAKIYPFQGAFFVGALYGQRKFNGSKVDQPTGLVARAEVTSSYLAPEIGWRWVWQSGFFMGMELGWQFVLSHTDSDNFSGPLAEAGLISPQTQQDIRDAKDKLGTSGLPILGLLQLGYFF